MTNRGRLSKTDLDLWRRATADVTPLTDLPTDQQASVGKDDGVRQDDGKPEKANGTKRIARALDEDLPRPAMSPGPRALDPSRPVDIDRRSWAKLKRGQIAIERTLDLHGRTQGGAHRALENFLAMATTAGLRCVLVVTGKGGIVGRGVLRQMVPRWLDEPGNRDKVLTYCTAQPRHGGDGALYVMLRRNRRAGL